MVPPREAADDGEDQPCRGSRRPAPHRHHLEIKETIAMHILGEQLDDQINASIDPDVREREFLRAVPQLRRFAYRLLPSVLEAETVIAEARDVWIATEGSFDVPIRHLLRLVAQGCIERQRAITRSMPEPTDEERDFLAIADVAQVSLLIAVNRLPRRAREAYVASVLGRPIQPEVENMLESERGEILAAAPRLDDLTATVPLSLPPQPLVAEPTAKQEQNRT